MSAPGFLGALIIVVQYFLEHGFYLYGRCPLRVPGRALGVFVGGALGAALAGPAALTAEPAVVAAIGWCRRIARRVTPKELAARWLWCADRC